MERKREEESVRVLLLCQYLEWTVSFDNLGHGCYGMQLKSTKMEKSAKSCQKFPIMIHRDTRTSHKDDQEEHVDDKLLPKCPF